jgi:hypothetical protein
LTGTPGGVIDSAAEEEHMACKTPKKADKKPAPKKK